MDLRLFVLFLLVATAPDAWAYVDPGSGMLLWQGLIAAFGVALAFVRRPWAALKNLLRRRKPK